MKFVCVGKSIIIVYILYMLMRATDVLVAIGC